jgi:hypothetical protein
MHRAGSVALLALIALVLGACGGSGRGETSGSSADASAVATRGPETDQPVETESLAPDLPGQSETDWGPIWDDVPAAYPVPDGAEPTEAGGGPVSAAYTVPVAVASASALADYYAAALEEGGYGGTGIDGPLEDGSFTVWSSSGYGCDSLVTIMPRRQESLVTVLFGAPCRFE